MSVASSGPSWADRYLPETGQGMPLPDRGSETSTITFGAVRGILFRQRLILVGIVLAALAIGLVMTLLTRPMYQAQATVMVTPNSAKVVEGQDIEDFVASNEIVRYMQTQGALIRSRKMAYRVVDALKLAERDDFFGEAPTGRKLTAAELKSRRETAASIVQGGVSVTIPYDNAIMTIAYSSPSPEFAALIANGYAENFILEDTRSSIETNANAQRILQEKIGELRGKLQSAELAANAYAKTNAIVGAPISTGTEGSSSPGQTITAANLSSVNATLTDLRTKRIQAEERWLAIANVPASRLPEVQQSGTLQTLVSDRSKAISELSQLRQRYGDNYPRIRELKAQNAALEAQINRLGDDVKTAVRDQYMIAKRQEDAVAAELQRVAGATLDEQDRRVRYGMMDRDAGALRTQLAALLDRYNQISAASNFATGTNTKLDGASVPGGPSSPNLAKNMLIALALGLVVAVIAAVLREFFDDRLRSPEEVERKLGYPMLGFTPVVSDDDLVAQTTDPFSSLMEAYSSIRTSIDFAVPGESRVLNVTSSQPSEGKSLTSTILARKYASLGFKTLLVDADLRRPMLATFASNKRPSAGFVEVLLGDVALDKALLPNQFENLDILSVANIPNNPVELLSSARLRDFIERVRQDYQLVIFDTPPVVGLADAPLLSRLVDATVFVIEANRAHFGQAKVALRRLRSAGVNIAGIVLTKYRPNTDGAYYYYSQQYYQYGDNKQ